MSQKPTFKNVPDFDPLQMGEILLPMLQHQQSIAVDLTQMILATCDLKNAKPEDVYRLYEESFSRVTQIFGEFMHHGELDD